MSKNEQLMLCDFQISKLFKINADKNNKMLGSIRFQAPEQLGLSTYVDDMKIDIWQAGLTLCILLTGTHPFSLHNIPECLNQMKMNKPDLSSISNSNIREMLQKLLHSDPNERPSAKALLNLQWLVREEGLLTPTEMDSKNKLKSKVGT